MRAALREGSRRGPRDRAGDGGSETWAPATTCTPDAGSDPGATARRRQSGTCALPSPHGLAGASPEALAIIPTLTVSDG